MLSPTEFCVGTFAQASDQGLTLMLPRSHYDKPILIVGNGENQMAIFLSDGDNFEAFASHGNDVWEGILVPGVTIEVDEKSALDPAGYYGQAGTVIRESTALNLAANTKGGFRSGRTIRVPVASGLPPCGGQKTAGFRNWRIVLGEGEDKRILLTVDVPAEVAAHG
jgi:hypothetical protein